MTADQCRGCPFPDQTAALELVRLREGIGRLASEWAEVSENRRRINDMDPAAFMVEVCVNQIRALLDDNEGER